MPPIPQQKAISAADIRSWDLDLEAMAAAVGWARRNPELLRDEVSQIIDHFPSFIAVAGQRLSEDRCWVEAAETLPCPYCGDLVVFQRGSRCVACQRAVTVPSPAAVGVVGRIPALISGRPFERHFRRRLARLERAGGSAARRAALMRQSLLEAGSQTYLAPRFSLWFSRSWPHAEPPVMVWPEYFEVLDIPPDHVFYADQYYRLCLFASWREQTAREVLQNRVVPRLLIDVMVADLAALDRLDEALDQLGCTLYQLYNTVGRPQLAGPFQQVYDALVQR